MKTIQSLADEMSNALVTKERTNGQKFVHLADGSPAWMTEVIRAVHQDKLPDDTTYSMIEDCLVELAGLDADASIDDAHEAIQQIDADVYTSNLTGWLHARTDHIFYLTQALEDFGPFTNGSDLLMAAQKIQIDEVGGLLIQELEKVADQEDADVN